MATDYADSFARFTLKINGSSIGGPYGWSETYEGLKPASKEAIVQLGWDLARYRANLLPNDHSVYECVYNEMGAKYKTLPCADDPVVGRYPPAAVLTHLGAGNTTLQAANGSLTGGNAVFTFQSTTELSVGFADACAEFRLLGDHYSARKIKLHGIPDYFCNDRAARGQDGVTLWYGETPYVIDTIPAVNANWWLNVEPFITFVMSQFRIVRKPGTKGVPIGTGGDSTKKYALCSGERAVYRKIGRKQVGRPFGLSVGAVLHR